jgi:hypothetical protein
MIEDDSNGKQEKKPVVPEFKIHPEPVEYSLIRTVI